MTLVARFLPHGIKRGRSEIDPRIQNPTRLTIRRVASHTRERERTKKKYQARTHTWSVARSCDFFFCFFFLFVFSFHRRERRNRRKSLASIRIAPDSTRREGGKNERKGEKKKKICEKDRWRAEERETTTRAFTQGDSSGRTRRRLSRAPALFCRRACSTSWLVYLA